MMKLVVLIFYLAVSLSAQELFSEELPSYWENVIPVKRSIRFPSVVQAKLYPAMKRPSFNDVPSWDEVFYEK